MLLLVNVPCVDLSMFTNPPMHYLLHARRFSLLLICEEYGNLNTVAYNCFYRVALDFFFVLLRCYLLSRNLIMCCEPFFTNLSIILKELLGFSLCV